MLRGNRFRIIPWLGAVLLVLGLAACSQQDQQTSVPQFEEKTFSLSPGSGIVKVSFLTGELQDMKVWERVEKGTGNIVEQPMLRATLKLKNTSENQAARPIAGTIEYVDAEGKAIPTGGMRPSNSTRTRSAWIPGWKSPRASRCPSRSLR